MSVLFVTLGIILIATGILGTVVPGLPGAVLVLAGFVWLAWLDDFDRLGSPTLVLLVVLTLVFQAIDPVATAAGARRVGAGRRAVIGAVLGTLGGLFFGLPGVILGPFVGAFLGQLTASGGVGEATRVGVGTWLGMLVGAVLKLALVFAMVGIGTVAFLV